MGWIKQKKKNEHVCKKPSLVGVIQPDSGDIWQCDDCDLCWKVREDQRDGLFWVATIPLGQEWG